MSSKNNKSDAHDRSTHGGNVPGRDILGGPDPAEREDIVGPPGLEPHRGMDILGGPDDAEPEDILTEPGHAPVTPAPHDILGGPDPDRPEDIMGPPRDD